MASRVLMPKLTDTMEDGVLLRWYKREGESVESGDILAEIETDKAIMDLEAYASGVLRRILVPEGARVPAGGLIAVIGREDEDIEALLGTEARRETEASQRTAAGPEAVQKTVTGAEHLPSESPAATQEPGLSVKASPAARKLASELGVDITQVRGTGPEGRITKADVERAAGEKPTEQDVGRAAPKMESAGQEILLSPMRRAIARKMVQSKAPVPHFYVTMEVRMDRALDLKAQLAEAWGEEAPSITGFILKACAIALQKVPAVNASFMEDRIRLHPEIHLGIAVGLEEGLIVPVLRNCERMNLRQLSRQAEQLIARARTRKMLPDEYTGATFSVSNLGMFGVDNFIAVISPPEAAALAVGRVQEQPAVLEGRIVPGRFMKVTLSCDHRVIDGVQAARFLQAFREAMEQPFRLLTEE